MAASQSPSALRWHAVVQAMAAERGGRLVSPKYLGSMVAHEWECADGHRWSATVNNVRNHGSWCPYCRGGVGEEIVRGALEEAFPGRRFERTRAVPWLGRLELDGYCEELSLAFEYQGIQHAVETPHFHRAGGAAAGADAADASARFRAQLDRDARKAALCDEHSVCLLVVPHTVPARNLRRFVRRALEVDFGFLDEDIAPPVGTDDEFYGRIRARVSALRGEWLALAREIVEAQGGTLLSENYLGVSVPLQVRCAGGHEFTATLNDLRARKDMCVACSGRATRTDDAIRAEVERAGFRLRGVVTREVGLTAVRARRALQVTCPAGHDYEVLADNFFPLVEGAPKKGGCDECSRAKGGGRGRPRRDIAPWLAEVKLEIVDGEFAGNAFEHLWRCEAAGHEFRAAFNSLKGKTHPCTECFLARASARWGIELRSAWTTGPGAATAKLDWRCARCGRDFQAAVSAIGRAARPPCKDKACTAAHHAAIAAGAAGAGHAGAGLGEDADD